MYLHNFLPINHDCFGFVDIQFDARQFEIYTDGRMIASRSRCRGFAVGYSFEKISATHKII